MNTQNVNTERAALDSSDWLGIVIGTLNEATEADQTAIDSLIEHRVPCNKALADHPTIQVGGDPCVVGMLGIINGIVERLTGKRVMAIWDDEKGLIRFDKYAALEGSITR